MSSSTQDSSWMNPLESPEHPIVSPTFQQVWERMEKTLHQKDNLDELKDLDFLWSDTNTYKMFLEDDEQKNVCFIHWLIVHVDFSKWQNKFEQLTFEQQKRVCLRTTSDGWTPLMVAVMNTHHHLHLDLLQSLSKGMESFIDVQKDTGKTALLLAVRNASYHSSDACVEFLLRQGANPNIKENCGWTALMLAARYSTTQSSERAVELLLDHGSEIDLQDKLGWTALMEASRYSTVESSEKVVELLLDKGANVNLQNTKGWTALMLACHCVTTDSSFGTIEKLVKAGAHLNLQNYYGGSALYVSIKHNANQETPEMQQTVELLLQHGAKVNIKTNDGKTVWNLCKCPIIQNLLRYYELKQDVKKRTSTECCICLEMFTPQPIDPMDLKDRKAKEQAAPPPVFFDAFWFLCGHAMHPMCFLKYIMSQSTQKNQSCPLCKKEIKYLQSGAWESEWVNVEKFKVKS